jgi:hypothetical protein
MPSDKSTPSPQNQKTSGHNAQIITPLKVGSQSGQPDSSRPFRFTVISILFLIIVLAAVTTGGLIFIRNLSKHPVNLAKNTDKTARSEIDVHRKTVLDVPKTTKLQSETVTKAPPVALRQQQPIIPKQVTDPTIRAPEKRKAEIELAAFLKLKKALEEKGASEWGGDKYEEMINLSREADTLLMDNASLAAAEKYSQARKKAAELADNAEAVFQKLIKEGQKALENGEGDIARKKFHTALKVEPSNTAAQRYLERAEKIDTVNRLIESGENHEKNNRLAFAHTDYQEALKLDSESQKAQKALNRVKEQIVGEQFQKLMSEGLTAYHNGNYHSARTKLLKAKLFRPDSREVKNALLQVDSAIRLDKIEKLHQKAITAEQTEGWEQALKSYLAVLKIDPNISFAVQGKKRSLQHIRIAKRMMFFLEKPGVMESDRQLENAILLIKEAEKLEQKGPQFNARLNALKTVVDLARTPVKVMIESDNLTEIAVYKVGKLGKFTARELSLRPGTYTVVGSRNGYQDVRLKITVKPGQKSLRVSIICNIKV